MGYTELLSRLTEDERQRFYLDNMKSSSEHLLKLVSDLLDFHRLDLNKAEVNRVTFNPFPAIRRNLCQFRTFDRCQRFSLAMSRRPGTEWKIYQ